MIQNKAARKFYRRNKVRRNADRRRYYRKHRDQEIQKSLERDHFNRYGITREQKYALLKQQGDRCSICKTRNSGKFDWHTDHDHITNTVRGILCLNCNHLLGKAKDSLKILLAAAAYLIRFKIGG